MRMLYKVLTVFNKCNLSLFFKETMSLFCYLFFIYILVPEEGIKKKKSNFVGKSLFGWLPLELQSSLTRKLAHDLSFQ